jgi:hypothetical protein
MSRQSYLLKLISVNTLALMFNNINVYARSIEIEEDNEASGQEFTRIPLIVCIIGVVAVAISGGFCLFSSKKKKRMSEEVLTNQNSNSSPNKNSPEGSSDEVHPGHEEADIAVQVDNLYGEGKSSDQPVMEEGKEEEEKEEEGEPQKKRKSILDSILNRSSKKEHRTSNIQFMEDRSLNSISTNEDWIIEQKYQAELKGKESEGLYGDEESNSNDGFWNSDLEPIQSSPNNQQESYAIPSLGKKNSVMVKRNSDIIGKHQSVIILGDDNKKVNSSSSSIGSTSELRPTRVKSWKDSDINKEIMEIMKHLDEDSKLNDIKQELSHGKIVI